MRHARHIAHSSACSLACVRRTPRRARCAPAARRHRRRDAAPRCRTTGSGASRCTNASCSTRAAIAAQNARLQQLDPLDARPGSAAGDARRARRSRSWIEACRRARRSALFDEQRQPELDGATLDALVASARRSTRSPSASHALRPGRAARRPAHVPDPRCACSARPTTPTSTASRKARCSRARRW